MVIGRSEDRDNPWDPLVLRHHDDVWDSIRVPHLGQRSYDRTPKGRTYDCIRPDCPAAKPSQDGGRPHMGPDLTREGPPSRRSRVGVSSIEKVH
jgi:hypothetical protein